MSLSTGVPVVTDITTQLAPISGITCIGEDSRGELYVANHLTGTVRKITSNPAPTDTDGDGNPDTCEVRIADINYDGRVAAADLSQLIAGWTTTGVTDLNQ